MDKRPYDIDDMLARIDEAMKPYPKAALFELQARGFGSAFEQLIACIISIRTLDEVMLATAQRLFAQAHTARQVAGMSISELDTLIHDSAFHMAKAPRIHAIAVRCVEEYGGNAPCNFDTLTSFEGVGPKCANLVLGIACDQPEIAVDVHVHRITNRWGYVHAATPEKTMDELERKVPREHWLDMNRLLVPFGKHQCFRRLPACSTCPVFVYCRQVEVSRHQ